jgi:putative endonuclease
MFYTYILRSLRDNTYYYGVTQNLEERLKEHNHGRIKFTKGHRPYIIHYFESFNERQEALKRERFFKSIDGYNWLLENKIILKK